MNEICSLTALEISRAVKEKEITVSDVLSAFIQRIDKYDGILNCFNAFDKEKAFEKAKEIQAGIENKKYKGQLAGVPIAVKDNICTKDFPTTCSSKMLEGFIPPYNASVIDKLEAEGLLIIGKLNMDEFAMGSATETSYFGPTKNPYDITRTAGGSSGGSAACVSMRLTPLSLGTDTGGSIRQPCSYCGVFGLKPTYSAVSRYGLVAYASSFDQIGPIAGNVDDCAALYSVIHGKDNHDSTCVDSLFSFENAILPNVKNKIIGIPEELISQGIDTEIREAVLNAAKVFEQLGAKIEIFNIPILKYAIPAYYIIACAQASSNLARYDAVKFGFRADDCKSLEELYIKSRSQGFGTEAKRRMLLGSFVLSSGYYDNYYGKALKARALISKAFEKAFEKYDIILSPVTPTTAPETGKSLDNPLKMYLSDICTVSANLTGLPACSCLCGFDKNNMPIGMQLMGKRFCEEEILSAAKAFEEISGVIKKAPAIKSGGDFI